MNVENQSYPLFPFSPPFGKPHCMMHCIIGFFFFLNAKLTFTQHEKETLCQLACLVSENKRLLCAISGRTRHKKSVLPQLKIRGKKTLQGQIPIWSIWGKAAVLRGWHFNAGGRPERQRQQNTWLAVSWIRAERTLAHYQIPYYIQSQNKLDKIREGAATGCQGTESWPPVSKCP